MTGQFRKHRSPNINHQTIIKHQFSNIKYLVIGYWSLVLVWSLVLGAFVLGCGQGGAGHGGPGGMRVPVVGFRAVEQPVEDRIAVVGTLAANESVEIRSELDGRVEELHVEEGRRVEAGTVLARIDRSKLDASLAEAEANLTLAEATLTRYQALADSQAVSRQEIDQARNTFDAKQAAVELIHAQQRDATVIAPFTGVLGARLISAGQYVTRGQLLTSLVDIESMNIEFNVPERFLNRLAEGQELEVRVAAYLGEPFRGIVYFIDPNVDLNTRTVPVKAHVPNSDGRLRAGMFANLDLILQVHPHAVVIPESALLLVGEEASVFVVEDGKAQARAVSPGIRMAGSVEIRSGLSAGELVVIEGTQKLGPGVPVQVREEARPIEEIAQERAGASPAVAVHERHADF